MKRHEHRARGLLLVASLATLIAGVALFPRSAFADAGDAGVDAGGGDGGTPSDGGDDGGSDSGEPAPVAVACDGSLCDTTNDSACTCRQTVGAPTDVHVLSAVTAVLGAVTLAITRRRRAERVKR